MKLETNAYDWCTQSIHPRINLSYVAGGVFWENEAYTIAAELQVPSETSSPASVILFMSANRHTVFHNKKKTNNYPCNHNVNKCLKEQMYFLKTIQHENE